MLARFPACFGLVNLVVATAFPRASMAEPSHSLEYSAVAGCPDEREFVGAVASRGARFEVIDGSKHERTALTVSIDKDERGFRGSFWVRSADGASNRRELRGATCAEVVDALAIVTAIALRPPGEGARSAGPSFEAAAELPDKLPLAGADEPSTVGTPAVRDTLTGRTDEPVRFGNDWALSLSGGVALGMVSSTPMPRIEVSVSTASVARRLHGGQRVVGPVIGLGATLFGDVSHQSHGFTTELGAQALTLRPCIAPAYDPDGLVLLACLEISAGLVGYRITDPNGVTSSTKSTGFGMLGSGVQLGYNFATHLHAGLRLGVDVLTNPITAEADNGTELLRSSRVLGYGALEFGMHF